MPTVGSRSRIRVKIPQEFILYINNVDYTDYISTYLFKESLNQLSEFEISLLAIDSTAKTNIMEGKVIRFQLSGKLIHKGIINRVEYTTDDFCNIKGYGAAESYLKDYYTKVTAAADDDSPEGRPIYTSVAAKTIIAEQLDATKRNVMFGVSGISTAITIRGDNDNLMSFLAGVSDITPYDGTSCEWWMSYGNSPYDNNYFNFDAKKNLASYGVSGKTFTTSGDAQNATLVSNEIDYENLWTSVTLLGYGDGVNQLRSKVYHATDNFTALAAGITNAATSATVSNGTVLPESGTVWIGMEQCAFTRVDNTLTLTRATKDGTDANNQDYKKAYAHSAKIPVWDAQYIELTTDGNSKIDSNGLKEYVGTDKTIIDQDALDMAAYLLLSEHWELIKRIKIEPVDIIDCLQDLDVGDTITVTDSEADLNGDYRIASQTLKNDEGWEILEYEVSNARLALLEELRDVKKKEIALSKYMQGSTSIFNVSAYENCDQEADHELNMRFRLPDDIVALTKVLLSYKIKNYRAYTTTTPSGGGSTSGGGAAHSHSLAGVTADQTWTYDQTFISPPYTSGGEDPAAITLTIPAVFSGGTFQQTQHIGSWWNWSGGEKTVTAKFYYGATELYSNEQTVADGAYYCWTYNDTTDHTGQIGKFQISATVAADEMIYKIVTYGKHAHSFTGQTTVTESVHTHTTPNHTHTQSFAIDTTTDCTGTILEVKAGDDGAENTVWSSTNSGTVSDANITDIILQDFSPGTGEWMNIKFTPDKPCRIEANAFIKCFIQSK